MLSMEAYSIHTGTHKKCIRFRGHRSKNNFTIPLCQKVYKAQRSLDVLASMQQWKRSRIVWKIIPREQLALFDIFAKAPIYVKKRQLKFFPGSASAANLRIPSVSSIDFGRVAFWKEHLAVNQEVLEHLFIHCQPLKLVNYWFVRMVQQLDRLKGLII
jgi:hypothetical protein